MMEYVSWAPGAAEAGPVMVTPRSGKASAGVAAAHSSRQSRAAARPELAGADEVLISFMLGSFSGWASVQISFKSVLSLDESCVCVNRGQPRSYSRWFSGKG